MAANRRRVVVVGAGAAGAMAAIFAASGGAETLLLERTPDGGRKILISGGGRCNVLPARVDESRFVTESSKNVLKKMVRSWPLREQIAFFENEIGIALAEEKETQKLFPTSNRAKDVRDGLFAFARRRGAEIRAGTLVTDLVRDRDPEGRWRITCEGTPPAAPGNVEALEADAVILATGGLSVPLSGSDGLGLSMLARLGHTIHPTYPALTPIVDRNVARSAFAGLAGISLPVTLSARGEGKRADAAGGLLFTHRGYSGPAVLDVSHVVVRAREAGTPARLTVRWTEQQEKEWDAALRAGGHRTVAAALRAQLPDRLAAAIAAAARVDPAQLLSRLPRTERLRLVEALVRGELPWTGDEGYAKAEVTGGGADLSEFDPRTMESRRHPGLFVCGEALDAFGPIGGYNFLWAWATGRAAGQGASTAAVSATHRSE